MLSIKNTFRLKKRRGSSIIELIIVTVLFAIMIPVALELFISARKISGQSYIQHYAAVNLSESIDILRHMRNQGYDLLVDGEFFLIRNPGTNSWLVKSDMTDKDTYERWIKVSNAYRHEASDDIYFDGDTGPSYEDPDTKKLEVHVLWAPSYIPSDLISNTFYISDWQNSFAYPST